MRTSITLGSLAFTLLVLPMLAKAELPGKYSDGNFTAEFTDAPGGGFTGTFTLGGQHYPATAKLTGTGYDGTFTAGSNQFPFTAALNGDTLALTTGGKSYTLKRAAASVNPLADPAPVNPLAAADPAATAGTNAIAGYTVMASTDSGKSLVAQKPKATSIQSALEETFPDLAGYFGQRPVIGKAYEDAGNHTSGGATFSANWNNQPVKGFVSCKLNDGGGATVAVLFAKADTSKADWEKLASPPAGAPAPSQSAPADSPAKVLGDDAQVYQFPDGTGSMTLAAGWKTQAQSAISAIFITGPADQNIAIGNVINIQTPDSPLMQMIAKNQATMRRMGMKPAPPPPFIVAKFTDPTQAMQDIGPQISKINQAHGGPSSHLDQLISHEDSPCSLKDGKAANVLFDVTRTLNGKSSQYRAQATIQMAPISAGVWMYIFNGCSSPTATFDKDLPIMKATIASIHINAQMAQQRMAEQNQQQMAMLRQQADANAQQLQSSHDQFMHDQAQRFADSQARHAQQEAGYQQHNDQFKADELQKSRSNADFVETIRGTRTIYDTQTGTTGTADLNYSSAVVDQLNTAALDPNRFVQIPLRDEMYPLPAGK